MDHLFIFTVCKSKADIAFIMNSSGRKGGASEFQSKLLFLQALVDRFSIAKDKVRVGVIVFSVSSHIIIHLNESY